LFDDFANNARIKFFSYGTASIANCSPAGSCIRLPGRALKCLVAKLHCFVKLSNYFYVVVSNV
ncbi:hypothetical protein, partial [Klebsiella pneumoniae]|uniref:hypothetical protein n=1 Tax=Klebsiella pneumoniae TaxID=573 RepID=UPI001C9A62F3